MIEDVYVPAPQAVTGEVSTESAAPPVTTPSAGETTPPANQPDGKEPQAPTPAGETKEQTAASEPDKDQSQEDQPKTWKEKRQERNRARWNEYKEAKAFTARRLESLEREVQQLRSAQPPDLSRINDPDEAIAQRTAWTVQQQTAQQREAQLNTERESAVAEQQIALQRAWDEHVSEARQRLPDFDQVFNANVHMHQRAVPFVVESDKGADIAYWLGKNPDAARALYDQFERAPAQALVELGRIEARVSAPPPKQVSTAPKPAPGLNGGVSPLAFDAQKASVDDMAQQLRKAGIIR